MINIQDTGKGIEEGAMKHLFEPFYTKKDGGTGLGLAITHSIVEQNGGRIHVSSKKNEKTTFQIVFYMSRITSALMIMTI